MSTRQKMLPPREVGPQVKAWRIENPAWIWPLRTGFPHPCKIRRDMRQMLIFTCSLNDSCNLNVMYLYLSLFPPAPLFLTWSIVNSVHWFSGSTQALPATTVLLLLGAWVLVGFPLTVIGGIVGKNRAGSFQAPCRTRNIARQIPAQPWYKHAAVHMAIGGFLPFR